MTRPRTHPKLQSSIPRKRNHTHPKRRQHHPHRNIRHTLRVRLPTLKLKPAIVPRKQPRKPNDHLPQWGVDVKVELALEVVGPEFTKVGFVPDDDVGCADFVEARPAGEEGVYYGRDVFEVLVEEFTLCGG